MSKKDEVIAKLKELASVVLAKTEVTTEEMKFTDAKLTDGTIIRYDAEVLEVGVIVSIVGTDASVLPAPMGSYELEDGTTFDVVDVSGIIDNVVIAPEETPVVPEVEAPAAMEDALPVAPVAKQVAKKIIESTIKESQFKAMEEKNELEKVEFSNQLKEVNEKLEKQSELINSMFALIQKLGEEDGAATVAVTNVFKQKTFKELKESFKKQLGN
jgi:hypothetical protein